MVLRGRKEGAKGHTSKEAKKPNPRERTDIEMLGFPAEEQRNLTEDGKQSHNAERRVFAGDTKKKS